MHPRLPTSQKGVSFFWRWDLEGTKGSGVGWTEGWRGEGVSWRCWGRGCAGTVHEGRSQGSLGRGRTQKGTLEANTDMTTSLIAALQLEQVRYPI